MINGLGERLQEQRTTHKLSQREVALALNVSPTVIALARFYHCSTDYLVGFEKPNANTINVSMLTDKQKNLLKLFLEEL